MKESLQHVHRIVGTELFKIGDTPISVSTLATVLAILVLTVWLSRAVRRLVERVLAMRGGRSNVVGTISGFIHYTILACGFGVALGTAGIDLTAMFAAGAFFAVALGFAMQSIAQNFVAGVILVTERSIKPGDVVEVDGNVVQVVEMGIRATFARTRDGEDLLIPNSMLIQQAVKNFTLKDSVFRIRVAVGVVYGSDMAVVKNTLLEVAREVSERWGTKDRETQTIMTGFGDHSVNWEIAIWMNDPWHWRQAISDLHETVWWAFKNQDIVIAFPQVDVHFDPPVARSLEQLAQRGDRDRV